MSRDSRCGSTAGRGSYDERGIPPLQLGSCFHRSRNPLSPVGAFAGDSFACPRKETMPMKRVPGGWFELEVTGQRCGEEYGFVLGDGSRVPDPASRWQPEVTGPSRHVGPASYSCNTDWKGRRWKKLLSARYTLAHSPRKELFGPRASVSPISPISGSLPSKSCRLLSSPENGGGVMTGSSIIRQESATTGHQLCAPCKFALLENLPSAG